MDRINQCLEILNSQPDLTTADAVKLLVKPLLQTVLELGAQITAQNAQIQALVSPNMEPLPRWKLMLTTSQEYKICLSCPIENCNKRYTQRSHVTRHVKDIVARGPAEPLYAEHKAELDKGNAKESSLGLADVTSDVDADPAENGACAFDYGGVGGLTQRGPGAGGLPLPPPRAWPIAPHAGTGLLYPSLMENPEESDNGFDFGMTTNMDMTGQVEGLPALDPLLDGMVPAVGAGVYGGPPILSFDQMEREPYPPWFGNGPGYIDNIGQLLGGGVRGGWTGSLGYPGVGDGQMGGVAPDAWQPPNATRDESQQEGRY
jgi:hypothetical protein